MEAQREKVEEVVKRLRSKLPAEQAAQLSSFDSYGLLDLYNHHSASFRQNSGQHGGSMFSAGL